MIRYFAAALALVLSVTAAAQPTAQPQRWADAVRVVLDAEFAAQRHHARYDFRRCDCGDVWVGIEQTTPDGHRAGQVLLIDGRLLLATGLGGGAPTESLMDAPALMIQLLLTLLERTAPAGPAGVIDELELAELDARRDLVVDTGTATGEFGAPWSVAGRVATGRTQQYRAELGFDFALPPQAPGDRSRIELTATLSFDDSAFPLADDASVDGWTGAWLGDPATQPDGEPASMRLGDVRRWVVGAEPHNR